MLGPCPGSPGELRVSGPAAGAQCICKACARVLLGPEERDRFLRAFRSARLERAHRAGIFKRVIEACKKRRICPACGAHNLTVKCARPYGCGPAHFLCSPGARCCATVRGPMPVAASAVSCLDSYSLQPSSQTCEHGRCEQHATVLLHAPLVNRWVVQQR